MNLTLFKFKKKDRAGESGNVLFLILIAVALFAALSYAVTSSTNSSGGNANDESNLVSSASITQYPTGIKTSILRMMVSKSYLYDELFFDKPPFTNLDDATKQAAGVFYPTGGGATYVAAPADVMADNLPGDWYFNTDFEVTNIGTNGDDGAGNDVIAFLPGIKEGICDKINEELGLAAVDTISTVDFTVTTDQEETGYTMDITADPAVNALPTGAAGLNGQPYGCVEDSAGEFIYYHVLIER